MKSKIGLLTFITLTISAAFLASCNEGNDWWYHTGNLKESDIGKIETVVVNNQKHRVRLIGINHDVLANGKGKAHTTWEFVDLLSDSDGYSLATLWNWEDGKSSNNHNYYNSNLRKALDGGGIAELFWYQKGKSVHSDVYNIPALLMLPKKLQAKIKKVKKPFVFYKEKPVPGYTVDKDSYEAKLFTLSYREMSQRKEDEPPVLEEGETYQYYKNHDDDLSRVHKQIKASEISIKPTDIKDGDHSSAGNYAGFNKSDGEAAGGYLWLRSPTTDFPDYAVSVLPDGPLNPTYLYNSAYAVAPAFCI